MTFIYFILCLLRHLLITIKICGFVKNTHFTIKILADPLIIHYSKFLTGIIRKNLNRYEYFQTCIWTRSLILVMSLTLRRMNINVWQVRNPGKFWLKNVFYFDYFPMYIIQVVSLSGNTIPSQRISSSHYERWSKRSIYIFMNNTVKLCSNIRPIAQDSVARFKMTIASHALDK